jgi:hypothetical protein
VPDPGIGFSKKKGHGFCRPWPFGFVYDILVLRISEKRRGAAPIRKAKKGESQKEGQNRYTTDVRSYRSRCHERKPLHHFSRCPPAHHEALADTAFTPAADAI